MKGRNSTISRGAEMGVVEAENEAETSWERGYRSNKLGCVSILARTVGKVRRVVSMGWMRPMWNVGI